MSVRLTVTQSVMSVMIACARYQYSTESARIIAEKMPARRP